MEGTYVDSVYVWQKPMARTLHVKQPRVVKYIWSVQYVMQNTRAL